MFGSRIAYYLRSLPTLARGVTNWWILPWLPFANRSMTVELRSGLRFLVRGPLDLWILKEVVLDRDYEVHGVAPLDGWRIIDVGAGLGSFSVLTAIECPRSEILAVEPDPGSFELLTKNLTLNQIGTVSTLCAALAPRSGTRMLRSARHSALASTTEITLGQDSRSAPLVGREVDSLTLANLMDAAGFEQCELLKMDCEGDEFEILIETRTQDLERVERLCLEYHDGAGGHHHQELVDRLERVGFEVRVWPNRAHTKLGFLYAKRIVRE
ncbi:MAG: FkbM family methyltransferase [Thermoanaerobaculia bacterium]|nr:FkbM family methyltransferase [Thermoanaerobaculia bacterium]